MFFIKGWSANEVAKHRNIELQNESVYKSYLYEYVAMSGEQNFLNAVQNYESLKGQQTNLYKCFLPQAWMINTSNGVSGFLHPNGVFDDPKGGILRKALYPHLSKHFRFENEFKLFREVGNAMKFSLNIYSNELSKMFQAIFNLFTTSTIDDCYEGNRNSVLYGIKDEEGNWNTKGHPDRVIEITKKELLTFARLFDGNDEWEQARLPIVHAKELLDVLTLFAEYPKTVANIVEQISTTETVSYTHLTLPTKA